MGIKGCNVPRFFSVNEKIKKCKSNKFNIKFSSEDNENNKNNK